MSKKRVPTLEWIGNELISVGFDVKTSVGGRDPGAVFRRLLVLVAELAKKWESEEGVKG